MDQLPGRLWRDPAKAAEMDATEPPDRRAWARSRTAEQRSDARATARRARAEQSGQRTGPSPGSVRHTLVTLGQLAPIAALLLALTGGVVGLATAAVLLGVTALLTARYVAGAGAEDGSYQRRARVMESREPSLADWYWTVRNGVDATKAPHPLRGRLRRLYAARLSERHDVSLFTEPERAARLVGADVWPWLDPSASGAEDALSPAVLAMLVDRLEAL